ncbi:hypothetical protein CC1G_01997 [Coprinopsis cinerea okayama7|uniref:Proteasome assembly chaperone 2 n=1 Tax=Coprinopsis cinerea (strain Okayama-7 / 130 / ATCC MYA-4618 / FGSC 9003) TaxID=240176 RepID=A8N687_COPC7|nr:hypothetical protein CC1G_01997 [Coprinopsis cinerea okayama7\|eukprot:XP_001830361.1 hypothetical protein CC1G_01997 [Coprinopsis cinerea okayama7\
MTFIYPLTQFNLSGKTLVVPIVSTANVGQLAADLLISTLSLERIAILDPSYSIPVVGAREDGSVGVTTPLELFAKSGLDLVVLQQRSPILVSRKQEFVDALIDFIQISQFSAVLFLSGVDPTNRADSQMFTPTFQLRVPHSPALADTTLQFLDQKIIPPYQQDSDSSGKAEVPFIPGGGLTRRILSSIPEGWAVPAGSLLQFVIEGDNRADATLLATVVSKVLKIESHIGTHWRPPSSWAVGLFGSPHEQDLYG